MYKINEFAKITGLPTSTLRYYDKENLLKPTLRQENNNYRYYSETVYEKAIFLALLRKNDFTISEMKDIMMTISGFSESSYYLIEKKKRIRADISKLENQIQSLDRLISEVKLQPLQQQYEVSFVEVENQLYMYREFAGEYDEMGSEVNKLYSSTKDVVCGDLFLLEETMSEEDEYRIGLPVKKQYSHPAIFTDSLVNQKGIQVCHKGAYNNIGDAYKYLIDYAKQHQLKTEEKFITRFIKSSGKIFKGNTNNYLTEVILLLINEKE